MELPAYHVPAAVNVLRATWERGWSFIKRAGTIILASSIILWFLQGFGFVDGRFTMVEDNNSSILAAIGGAICLHLRSPGLWGLAVHCGGVHRSDRQGERGEYFRGAVRCWR